jgi:hypothetical protein
MNTMTTNFTVPEFADGVATFVVLSAFPALGYVLQIGLQAPSSSTSSWSESISVGYPDGHFCNYVTGSRAALGQRWAFGIFNGRAGRQQNGWLAFDPLNHWLYSDYCPAPDSYTTFQSTGQEPIVFESYDLDANVFLPLLFNVNPVFQYGFHSPSFTWSNTNAMGAWVVNANDAGLSWPVAIGGGEPTPSTVVEAGWLQNTNIGYYQVYMGSYRIPPLNQGGTQVFDTMLLL